MTRFKQKLTTLTLVPHEGGRFEVSINGKQVYSKLETGAFPEHKPILKAVEEALG